MIEAQSPRDYKESKNDLCSETKQFIFVADKTEINYYCLCAGWGHNGSALYLQPQGRELEFGSSDLFLLILAKAYLCIYQRSTLLAAIQKSSSLGRCADR